MDASARRSRGRAQENPLGGSPVGIQAEDRAGDELPQIRKAAVDIAADQIRVSRLHLPAILRCPHLDTVAKSRRETLNLRFNAARHVLGRSVGHVAVDPGCMLPGRSPAVVKQTVLRDQDKRSFGRGSAGRLPLAQLDLLQRPADMDRPRAAARPWPSTGLDCSRHNRF